MDILAAGPPPSLIWGVDEGKSNPDRAPLLLRLECEFFRSDQLASLVPSDQTRKAPRARDSTKPHLALLYPPAFRA